ncbi:uncharacterized protein LOC119690004 [Teleopsis dalmanni]|uniref:uncharacterized protein LOC119690004 n=1 Tax=Teleopsis dalmanni TaxID=139649 RepID=UPI0018CF7BDF|nr:uncharacterized protein LOC119690004 [Teleopsis dalmanni]
MQNNIAKGICGAAKNFRSQITVTRGRGFMAGKSKFCFLLEKSNESDEGFRQFDALSPSALTQRIGLTRASVLQNSISVLPDIRKKSNCNSERIRNQLALQPKVVKATLSAQQILYSIATGIGDTTTTTDHSICGICKTRPCCCYRRFNGKF